MIVSAVNLNALLPCLATLCALLVAAITAFAILTAKLKRKADKYMKNNVYTKENATLSCDCENSCDNGQCDNGQNNAEAQDENGSGRKEQI